MKEITLTENELRGYLLKLIAEQAGGNRSKWANERRIHATRISEFLNGAAPTKGLLNEMGITTRAVYVGQRK